MIRRPPRSTQGRSSAASDVYKRQVSTQSTWDDTSYNQPCSSTMASCYKWQSGGYCFSINQATAIGTCTSDMWSNGSSTQTCNVCHDDALTQSNCVGNFLSSVDKSCFKRYPPPNHPCLLYTSPSPRDVEESRMPSSA
eukprot:TRINITY_DN5790_c0_g1_i1.p2 TRINITY_DN5790_c0_g1~~TRINITY_DN5790_c0_g1_i1.p2  ORF type:complete len:138 (+),score=82.14 TRINITY_DN5790_c0_g1_i1:2-415(+)